MRKIRVAFFAEILIEDFDGAVRTIFQLINRIDKSRFEFLFVYGAGPKDFPGFDSIKVPSVTLPFNTHYSMALPGLAKTKLDKKLRVFSPDVIHITTPSLLGGFGLKYAVKNKLPVITIYHTHFISYLDYYLKYAPFLIKSARKAMAGNHKNFYNQCDKVYVPSQSIKEELIGIGVLRSRMKIWKRGINSTLFSPVKRDTRMIKCLTGNEHPTILFASRLVWEKNLETLFDIYDELQASKLKFNFLIAGEGAAKKACKSRMKSAIFVGSADHDYLAKLYASSDVFVFPSVSETYGNVVPEAMASGLPCVIADGGGSKDFIVQGVNGFKCQPYNAADYADKIRMVLTNKHLRHHIAAEGLNISNQLSWDQLARIYFEDLVALTDLAVLQPA